MVSRLWACEGRRDPALAVPHPSPTFHPPGLAPDRAAVPQLLGEPPSLHLCLTGWSHLPPHGPGTQVWVSAHHAITGAILRGLPTEPQWIGVHREAMFPTPDDHKYLSPGIHSKLTGLSAAETVIELLKAMRTSPTLLPVPDWDALGSEQARGQVIEGGEEAGTGHPGATSKACS